MQSSRHHSSARALDPWLPTSAMAQTPATRLGHLRCAFQSQTTASSRTNSTSFHQSCQTILSSHRGIRSPDSWTDISAGFTTCCQSCICRLSRRPRLHRNCCWRSWLSVHSIDLKAIVDMHFGMPLELWLQSRFEEGIVPRSMHCYPLPLRIAHIRHDHRRARAIETRLRRVSLKRRHLLVRKPIVSHSKLPTIPKGKEKKNHSSLTLL